MKKDFEKISRKRIIGDVDETRVGHPTEKRATLAEGVSSKSP